MILFVSMANYTHWQELSFARNRVYTRLQRCQTIKYSLVFTTPFSIIWSKFEFATRRRSRSLEVFIYLSFILADLIHIHPHSGKMVANLITTIYETEQFHLHVQFCINLDHDPSRFGGAKHHFK